MLRWAAFDFEGLRQLILLEKIVGFIKHLQNSPEGLG